MSVKCVPGNFTQVLSRLSPTWVYLVIGAYLLPMMSMEPLIVVQLLSHVQLFVTMGCSIPGSPSFTISWSLLKLMSIDLVMPSGHYILLPAPAPLGGSFPLALSHHAVLSGCKTFHLLCYHLPPMPSYPAMSQAHLSTNVCCGCAQSPVMPDSLRPHGLQCSPLSSFVHGILQAAILEWVAIFSSRGSSWPRDWTCVFCLSCIGRFVEDIDTMRTFYLNLNRDFKAENFR